LYVSIGYPSAIVLMVEANGMEALSMRQEDEGDAGPTSGQFASHQSNAKSNTTPLTSKEIVNVPRSTCPAPDDNREVLMARCNADGADTPPS
jgi:hypothetical protein